MMGGKLAAIVLAALCLFASGCGGNRGYSGERRFSLSGKVTVDGEPMESGVISFLPQDKGGRVSGGPIKGGTYEVPEAMGATAGIYRVEVRWNKPTGRRVKDAYGEEIMDEYKEGLPARYHSDSELTAEVSAKQTKFDFDLKSK
jgi:hypothetical protein